MHYERKKRGKKHILLFVRSSLHVNIDEHTLYLTSVKKTDHPKMDKMLVLKRDSSFTLEYLQECSSDLSG